MADIQPRKKTLTVFHLVMINIVAVDSLRSLPIGAKLGLSLFYYYGLATLFYLLPLALVTAELATGWPNRGGIYVWIREAFGARAGFLVVWLQWIYNVVWYPTILSFIAGTLAYLFDPSLVDNKIYMLLTTVSIFWLTTLINCFGMKISSLISTLGAIIGTIIPMVVIISIGAIWFCAGKPLQIDFSWQALIPQQHLTTLPYYLAILFGLMGIELSAVHADEVKNPKRDYPVALVYSTFIIIITLVLSTLAIVLILPNDQINLVSGLMAAFASFFAQMHLSFLLPMIAIMIVIGSFASVSTWIIGPTKGFLVAAEDTNLPRWLKKTNRHGVPTNILILQGIIFTLLCSLFLISPTVTDAYWVLSALTAQLALIVYMFLFSAALYLRLHQADVPRGFHIPGGKVGISLIAGFGLLTCIFAFLAGFIPPDLVAKHNELGFVTLMVSGILIFLGMPLIFSFMYNK